MTFRRLSLVTLLSVLSTPLYAVAQSAPSIHSAKLAESKQKTPNISTEELRQILADNSATVFDVRTYQEYAISHIPGVVNVEGKPGTTRGEFTSDVDEIGHIVDENRAAAIVLYCGGPYCGKSKRVAGELVEAGYTSVSRYQLGIPVWRALGGVTEIELEGIRYVLDGDQTAVFIDARGAAEFSDGTVASAQNIPAHLIEPDYGGQEVKDAKQDGRLPMEDHNTRVIVVGDYAAQATVVAQALAWNAFYNVSYFPGTFAQLRAALSED